MHFDSLKVVSEHLVERIKLEDSLFRDVFQSGASYSVCAASTPTSSSYSSPWGITPQCNLNTFGSYVNDTAVGHGTYGDNQNKTKTNSVATKEQNSAATNNFNKNMNNNFMCTTMFLMNDSLQPNNTHQSHSNSKKHNDIFNITCEKGCSCESTNPLFRTSSGQVFSADKHAAAAAAAAAAKHFMAPCGPLQLTAQECSEFLLKKVAVSNSLLGSDSSHVGAQNNCTTNNTHHKNRHSDASLESVQETDSTASGKVTNTVINTGQKYRVAKERPFSCQECGKSFLLKHHLVTHARVHTGERPHVCTECGKSFAHKHCLSTHLLLHSSQRPYQCPECKKSFTLKHHLVTHARVHSRDRPFVCRECGRTFPQKRHLATHAKFHSGERPHVCEECGESFSREEHLVIHSRFHGGQHPYVCPDCGSTFARKFELVNHGRLHGRIPHSCDICGKEFLQKRTLLAHARLHVEGERPFVCQHCGETFQRKTELVEHSNIHADDKSFVCR
jgi:DNA-directed RNA polymerase subunit RPC12/RpoP